MVFPQLTTIAFLAALRPLNPEFLSWANGTDMPTLEIVERMIEKAPGITRIVDGPERRHFVSRQRDQTDRRIVLCRIERKGIAVLAQLDSRIDQSDLDAMKPLRPDEISLLIAILGHIRHGR